MARLMAPSAATTTDGSIMSAEGRRAGRARNWRYTVAAFPQLWIGAIVLGLLVIAGVLAGLIAPYGFAQTDARAILATPSAQHLLGTDTLGRDTFSRILYGIRLSLLVSVLTVLTSLLAGVTLGLISGYRSWWLDGLIMRAIDGLMAFPSLVLALTIAFALGPSLRSIVIALAVVRIPGFARLTRGQMLVIRNQEFAVAAEAVGVGPVRLVLRHCLPNLVSVILIQASLAAGATVFAEASLSFLGVSVPPPTPTLGGMLRDGYIYLETNPWQSIAPGAFIFLAVLSFNFIGDGLRDLLDPQQRRRVGR